MNIAIIPARGGSKRIPKKNIREFLGRPVISYSIEIANKSGIDLTDQRARQFSEKDFDNFDKIYAMDTHNYANIISLARNQSDREKVDVILNELNPESYDSVPDPYYGDGNGFHIVYDMLDKACDRIVGKL